MSNLNNLETRDDAYILVLWPESQTLMEYDWFREECYLLQALSEQEHLDSAYFVPVQRLKEIEQAH